MKRRDFEDIIKKKGFFLIRNERHLVYAHARLSYRVVIPTGKEINKMICKRLLKEIDKAFEGHKVEVK